MSLRYFISLILPIGNAFKSDENIIIEKAMYYLNL